MLGRHTMLIIDSCCGVTGSAESAICQCIVVPGLHPTLPLCGCRRGSPDAGWSYGARLA